MCDVSSHDPPGSKKHRIMLHPTVNYIALRLRNQLRSVGHAMSCANSPMFDSCANSFRPQPPRILLDVDGMPRLPLELERMIFELAASRNGVKASAPLLLVAKRVREWYVTVKPLFFPLLTERRGLSIQNYYRTAPLMFRVLNQIWPPRSIDIPHLPQLLQSAGHFVQYLIIDSSSACGSFRNILSSCPNLCSLAIHLPSVEGIIRSQDILKLLEDHSRLLLLELLVVIPLIPFDDEPRLETEVKLLSHNKVKDKRLVVLKEVHSVDVVYDWKKGANGGVDMWRFAELVVFARESEYFYTRSRTL